MWVRSQDKKILSDVGYVVINRGEYYSYLIGYSMSFPSYHDGFVLGEYITEEKAMEVLDELQCIIEKSESDVYQMPEDDDE